MVMLENGEDRHQCMHVETAKCKSHLRIIQPKRMWIPGLTLDASVRWPEETNFQKGNACISMREPVTRLARICYLQLSFRLFQVDRYD